MYAYWELQISFPCMIDHGLSNKIIFVFLKPFRWHNHLNPDIKKDAWTLEEELTLLNAHRINGNKWAELAKLLPGRYHSSANL